MSAACSSSPPRRVVTLAAACICAAVAGACASPPGQRRRDPAPGTAPARTSAREEAEPAIARATRALEAGDVVRAREQLEAHLEDEPDDTQARYVLARALAAQGELRAARVEVERSLAGDGKSALAWALLAGINEQMGEHRRALHAYARVHELVAESLDPLHGMARCLLFLGAADDALATIAAARERPIKDPMTEHLAFQALRRLGHSQEAERVGRAFLELVASRGGPGRTGQTHDEREVRRWLELRSQPLEADVRRIMVDAVRAAIKLRLPGTQDPEDEVLREGPPRLFAFDERPVFVTVYPGFGRAPLRGRGRGKTLSAALKGAIQEIHERPGFAPLMAKDAAVQVEVGHTLEPIVIKTGGRGDLETDPPLRRGTHGVALRIDRQEAYSLPSEALTGGLPDLASVLAHATRSAGHSPEAWQGAAGAFRFETDAWLSPGPGLAIAPVEGGEPMPLPQGLPGELRDAAQAGARWLTTQLRPEPLIDDGAGTTGEAAGAPDGDGEAGQIAPAPVQASSSTSSPSASGPATTLLARSHDPTGRTTDPGESTPADAARVALACATAQAASEAGPNEGVLLSAAEHLLERLRPLLPPRAQAPAHDDPLTQARLEADALATLALLATYGRGASTGLDRDALAASLHRRATPTTRVVALLGLLRDGARDRQALDDLAGLAREEPRDALGALALAALDEVSPELGAGDRVLRWARAQLDQPLPGEDADAVTRAQHLTAMARTARLAARRGAPEADPLRARTLEEARGLLALQLGPRHRHFVRNQGLSLGGFRSQLSQAELRPVVTAECVLALMACVDLLDR